MAIHSGMDEEATAQFMRKADSPKRLVAQFSSEKFITFDGSKIKRG